jgi:plastocyanin
MDAQEAVMDRSARKASGLCALILAVAGCSTTGAPLATEPGVTPSPAVPTATSLPTAPSLAPPTQAIVRISPNPAAPDSGVSITLIAAHAAWNVSELSVPADKVWHLVLDNEDHNIPHNFVIAHRPELQATIFGPKFNGIATMTFDIPGLPAGTYQFICSLHPESMTGVLTIN